MKRGFFAQAGSLGDPKAEKAETRDDPISSLGAQLERVIKLQDQIKTSCATSDVTALADDNPALEKFHETLSQLAAENSSTSEQKEFANGYFQIVPPSGQSEEDQEAKGEEEGGDDDDDSVEDEGKFGDGDKVDKAEQAECSSGQENGAAKEATLLDCLDLLKGPSDERRLVGLLLVTKFLDPRDIETAKAIFSALDDRFLTRLLRSSSQPSAPVDGSQPAAIGAAGQALALAVCGAFARLPELAASSGLIEKIPLFLAAVRSEPPIAVEARCDALESLYGVALGSEEGRRVALESSALPTVCTLLAEQDASEAAPALLGVQLLATLLAHGDGEAAHMHSSLEEGSASAQVKLQGASAARIVPLLAGFLAGPPGPMQLEALRAMLLVLSAPAASSGLLGIEQGAGEWPAQVRQGLQVVLRSKVPHVQRHAALRLASALVELRGAAWLDAGDDGGFVQLLTEVIRVETLVLLHELERCTEGSEADMSRALDAMQLIPTCYHLAEAIFQMLVLGEDDDDAVGDDGSGSGQGPHSGGQLSDAVVGQALSSLREVVHVVVEHLESAEQYTGVQDAAEARAREELVLASLRLVCCFLSQMPEAFLPQIPVLLPRLFQAAQAGLGSAGVESEARGMAFLLPAVQALAEVGSEGRCAALHAESAASLAAFVTRASHTGDAEATGVMVQACAALLQLLQDAEGIPDVLLQEACEPLRDMFCHLETWARAQGPGADGCEDISKRPEFAVSVSQACSAGFNSTEVTCNSLVGMLEQIMQTKSS
ncbi:hypothetical protein CYMTET_24899 [Cymbomonas tetramitiformis]|uniref:Neurochondrin n=1 Tax=Cymbomonas tetramitiformis TaxID=36881 RepID=A0AAE0KZS2_9CHLO|nr:hypothetical protein CYMTET_24899 [Cymbomonas tetramitiformis]